MEHLKVKASITDIKIKRRVGYDKSDVETRLKKLKLTDNPNEHEQDISNSSMHPSDQQV